MPQPPEYPPKPPNSATPNPGYPPPGPQPPDPPLETNQWSSAHEQAPFRGYEINSSYVRNNGVLQIPIAGPPGTSPVLIQLHGGYMRKIVSASGRREGFPPIMPDPTAIDPDGGVQASYAVSPMNPVFNADGETPVYVTNVSQTFYYTTFFTPATGYRLGQAPVYVLPASPNVITGGDFNINIL